MRGAKTEQEDSFIFAMDTTETLLSLPTRPWRLPDPIWGHPTALAGASPWRPLGLALRRLTRAPDTPEAGRGGEGRGRFLPQFQWENKEKRRQLRNLGLGCGSGNKEVVKAPAAQPLRAPSWHCESTQITALWTERQSL